MTTPFQLRGWFATLFLTDMWERFGFYGMQAILVLFAVAPVDDGGLGLPAGDASALFAAHLGLSFLAALPGGWLGDRVLGQQRAIALGTLVLAAGYLALSVGPAWCTALGLFLTVCGAGLFKPNQQALVNTLCGADSGRREAAISMFYVGIQISALASPLICGFLGERVDWRLGFAASGVAMLIGAVQFAAGRGHFGAVGAEPHRPLTADQRRRTARRSGAVAGVVALLVAAGAVAGALSAQRLIIVVGLLTLVLPAGCYLLLARNPQLTAGERRRLRPMLWIFLGSGLFWMLVAQASSVLNIFAKDHTDRDVLGFTLPASWLQSATPLGILVLAPVLAWSLPRLGARAGAPVKFGVGLLLAGASFLVMAVAASLAVGGERVSVLWLLVVYALHACGELVIAAVGISTTADVVSPAFLGQTLGVYWLFAALGGGLGSGLVRLVDVLPDQVYYLALGSLATAVGVLFLGRRKRITTLLRAAPAPAETVSSAARPGR
ncbi:peptide MFS transporter [Asanoa sp. WMMD1127]|uniref:peptide MFS transporter n=1 Tax=Asanoa sp. WMMD1127 TaxID=3016107 RepID=UPI002416B6AD|nr:peptide MFS transporter [Asanoa sp. WMMD1127]MDG4820761.1 peptide MFS transporter [Asanoa sp. WMMD1127]